MSQLAMDYDDTRRAAAELRRLAAIEAQRDALRAELKEATEAINDPAVNNLRTLPESIRVLCAQRDALLEALKEVEPILVRMYGQQAADLPPVQIVRAAIAKAEGDPCA